MDLNLLAVFVAVAETSGFSAAARRLSIPKSSVSRSIAALEAAMGVQLVLRTTRRVALSSAGTALFDRIAPLLASLHETIEALPELAEQPSGELRITAPVDFGSAVLADIVARFSARNPAVSVNLYLSNQVVDLVAQRFDAALRISSRRLKDSSLVARNLGPIGMQLFAAPAYLARRGVPRTPAELPAHDWIVFRGGGVRLESSGKSVEVTPRGRITCDDMSFVREAVRAGAGLGVLPRFLADAEVAAGQLVRVLPRWNLSSGDLWIVYPGSRNVPRKVAAFRDFVAEALASRPLA